MQRILNSFHELFQSLTNVKFISVKFHIWCGTKMVHTANYIYRHSLNWCERFTKKKGKSKKIVTIFCTIQKLPEVYFKIIFSFIAFIAIFFLCTSRWINGKFPLNSKTHLLGFLLKYPFLIVFRIILPFPLLNIVGLEKHLILID